MPVKSEKERISPPVRGKPQKRLARYVNAACRAREQQALLPPGDDLYLQHAPVGLPERGEHEPFGVGKPRMSRHAQRERLFAFRFFLHKSLPKNVFPHYTPLRRR